MFETDCANRASAGRRMAITIQTSPWDTWTTLARRQLIGVLHSTHEHAAVPLGLPTLKPGSGQAAPTNACSNRRSLVLPGPILALAWVAPMGRQRVRERLRWRVCWRAGLRLAHSLSYSGLLWVAPVGRQRVRERVCWRVCRRAGLRLAPSLSYSGLLWVSLTSGLTYANAIAKEKR